MTTAEYLLSILCQVHILVYWFFTAIQGKYYFYFNGWGNSERLKNLLTITQWVTGKVEISIQGNLPQNLFSTPPACYSLHCWLVPPWNLNSSTKQEEKIQNAHGWRRTLSQMEAEKWYTQQLRGKLISKKSFSNLFIFAFVCTWKCFLLSFVLEFTSCSEQYGSLLQLMLSYSLYIVSLWVFW